MKNVKSYLIAVGCLLLTLFTATETFAQFSCATPTHSEDSRAEDILHRFASITDNNEYCVRIYIYNIRQTNGDDGLSLDTLEDQVFWMNYYFRDTDIHFEWDGTVTNIDDSDIWDRQYIDPSPPSCNASFDSDQFDTDLGAGTSYYDPNGINIYFRNNFIDNSFAYGVADKPQILFSADAIDNGILAHELGHTMGLLHTRHGTFGNGLESIPENCDGFGPHVVECPDGLNGNSAGDYVADTAPDSGADYNIGSNCSPSGAGTPNYCDPLGPNYGFPNADNFMLTGQNVHVDCIEAFTPGQALRMKYYLANSAVSPAVQQAVESCPVYGCQSCDGAQASAEALRLHFFEQLDCDTWKVTYPFIVPCGDTYTIGWNGQEVGLNALNNTATTTFPSDGEYTVSITVTRPGLGDCGPYDFPIHVDCGGCTACNLVMSDIIGSLDEHNGICNIAKIDVPDISGCYTGTVKWESGVEVPLVSNSTMTHLYTSNGDKTVTIELLEAGSGEVVCAQASDTITIECPPQCTNPCDGLDATYTYTGQGCLYNFDGEWNTICPSSTYSFSWEVINLTTGQQFTLPSTEDVVIDFSLYGGTSDYRVGLVVQYSSGTEPPNFCGDRYDEIISITCRSEKSQITLFPNPTTGAFTVQSASETKIKQISVRNLMGRSVLNKNVSSSSETLQLPVRNKGIYFVEVLLEDGSVVTKKLIVE